MGSRSFSFGALACSVLAIVGSACRRPNGGQSDRAASSSSSINVGAEEKQACAFQRRDRARKECEGEVRTVQSRPFCVVRPKLLKTAKGDASEKLPLVVLLHGFGSSGLDQMHYFGFDALAEAKRFILVTPDGTENRQHKRYWGSFDAGDGEPGEAAPDDVAYLDAILDDVEKAYPVDTRSVFFVGHSNGGFMAHRYACERSEKVAAVVSLAGAVDPAGCQPKRPVAVLEVHGTSDRVIRFDGGVSLRSLFQRGDGEPKPAHHYPGAVETVAFWGEKNHCRKNPVELGHRSLVCESSGATEETEISGFEGCDAGGAAELWKMDGVGHIPNFLEPAWGEAVYGFLEAHHR